MRIIACTTILVVLVLVSTITVTTVTTSTYATTGMGNCKDQDNCIRQPDRVGADNDDPDNAGEDADRDGPGGDDGVGQEEDDDTGEANCWGQVTKALADNDDGQPGIGEHTSDPRPGDDDNETPREGVGNQKEGHPSDHADTVGGLADDVPDCVD